MLELAPLKKLDAIVPVRRELKLKMMDPAAPTPALAYKLGRSPFTNVSFTTAVRVVQPSGRKEAGMVPVNGVRSIVMCLVEGGKGVGREPWS